jgi:hypothetical protein
MTQSPPNPAKWLIDPMTAEHAARWPTSAVADTAKAFSATAAPWMKGPSAHLPTDLTAKGGSRAL